MIDFASLFDFSRQHCVAICAVLVPANLLATFQTLLFTGLHRPASSRHWITLAASTYALLMLLHVMTWYVIGVVMAPTFILMGLGLFCITVNGWAIARPQSLEAFLRSLVLFISHRVRQWNRLKPQT
ncbi:MULTISPECIES: hypothetical protein [unclassified Leptolyngbya]|uniref:hypothetical protein n=1 Tax=unclassified Leptolyngbya TaxID=2650499 RepID=UPI0016877BA6|nr:MULTISPECIES: hypothetical protein [unclassified Leptolyngbya]MBD1914129.1 hypothetical protein [Leptolyngbya sp. FACHB-8]MBD2158718.1 hypothetical protein [Leptolyngbya sp. FACHB-16]